MPETETTSLFVLLAVLAAGFVAYFLPAGIAVLRNHQNALAISVLNLLLGWSLIGWIAALVWSFTATHRQGSHA